MYSWLSLDYFEFLFSAIKSMYSVVQFCGLYVAPKHFEPRKQPNLSTYMLFLWPKPHCDGPYEYLQTLCSLQRRKVEQFLPRHEQESKITSNQTFSVAVELFVIVQMNTLEHSSCPHLKFITWDDKASWPRVSLQNDSANYCYIAILLSCCHAVRPK